jgi:pimeloyl-ACP methyl ester carboxylesterase
MRPVFSLTIVLLAPALAAGEADPLDRMVRDYFLAGTDDGRESRLQQILAMDDLTADRLAESIRRAPLWQPEEPGIRELTFLIGRHAVEMDAWVRVPADYTPARRWPVIITLHGTGGHPKTMLNYTIRLLGSRVDEFIVVAPDKFTGMAFSMPPGIVGRPRSLLDAVRRRFRVDSDRVYLCGYSLGGSNTWMGAVMHADCFAGAMPLANFLQIVGGTTLWDEVLPNCRHTAILFCWGENDTLNVRGKPDRKGGIARMSRNMTSKIQDLAFDQFQAFELTGIGHANVVPPPPALATWLEQRRVHYPPRVRQAFRLAEQSRAYWVEAARLRGKPLSGGKLRIEMRPGETWAEAKQRYLTGRLGVIEAECRGQSIQVKTRRTAELVLLLSDELLDLDQPVIIERDGRSVLNDRVTRDLRVMLTEASRSWDFERLYSARVVVTYGGKVSFGYPADEDGRKPRRRRGDRQ